MKAPVIWFAGQQNTDRATDVSPARDMRLVKLPAAEGVYYVVSPRECGGDGHEWE